MFSDNPQSTSNPVIHPVIPVSTTVSSNSSQNITSRLTSDENIVEVLVQYNYVWGIRYQFETMMFILIIVIHICMSTYKL